jgi:hypothetical protein
MLKKLRRRRRSRRRVLRETREASGLLRANHIKAIVVIRNLVRCQVGSPRRTTSYSCLIGNEWYCTWSGHEATRVQKNPRRQVSTNSLDMSSFSRFFEIF